MPRPKSQIPDVEKTLLAEQESVALLVNRAVKVLSNPSRRQQDKDAVAQTAQKLSTSAQITARTLTKITLDCKYPRKKRTP